MTSPETRPDKLPTGFPPNKLEQPGDGEVDSFILEQDLKAAREWKEKTIQLEHEHLELIQPQIEIDPEE